VNAHKNVPIPTQEPGVRPARALPYTLNAHGLLQTADNSFAIDFANTGTATAVFQARSGGHTPRTYTVEPGKMLNDTWLLCSIGLANCYLSVYGPNGFFRSFQGAVSALHNTQLDIHTSYDPVNNGITVTIGNPSGSAASVAIVDRYTNQSTTLTI